MRHRILRTLSTAVVLSGGMVLLAPQKALACEPEPDGCSSCVIHEHEDGIIHITCCSWAGDGSFQGCETRYLVPN